VPESDRRIGGITLQRPEGERGACDSFPSSAKASIFMLGLLSARPLLGPVFLAEFVVERPDTVLRCPSRYKVAVGSDRESGRG
jgi:hypothetical protein